VTKRKQAEREVQNYRQHLEELVAERTAALEMSNKELEAFSYSIAHDLRAPLRSITGFSQILLEDTELKLNEQEQRYFQRIIAGGKHMAQLIDDILELSRISRSDYTEQIIDLSAIAQVVVDNLLQNEPARMVEVNITPHLLCKGDARLLRSALENLLDNAWKYSSKSPKALIEFGLTEINGENVHYVRDNGAGFDMRYADKLFKPFQRMHKSDEFEGTGIGLATVQRVITRHGGKVWAEAEVNHGATFYFTLNKAGERKES
jgi:light-regulated signal transduction histidine kinase (bacteriophytochrome)